MQRTIVILSVSSDIGKFLASQYLNAGHKVIGTYRTKENAPLSHDNLTLIQCDLSDDQSANEAIKEIQQFSWDTFISCAGNPLPVKKFFEASFDEWADSFSLNAEKQLHILHSIYQNASSNPNAIFLSSAGLFGAVKEFSPYITGKIALVKMAEFLAAEYPNLNIFTVGPGWTKTKTHDLIVQNTSPEQQKHKQTKEFIETKQGTSLQDIYECIEWGISQGVQVVSGRNISVVHDPWRDPNYPDLLKSSPDRNKLRKTNE